jgi:hypothetical protein
MVDPVGVVIILIVAGFVVVPLFARWRKTRGWQSWPSKEGTVETSEVQEISTRAGSYFVVDLGYSYLVNGEYYSGHLIQREPEPYEYARAMKDSKVMVRFHPEKPESSKLEIDAGRGILGLLGR